MASAVFHARPPPRSVFGPSSRHLSSASASILQSRIRVPTSSSLSQLRNHRTSLIPLLSGSARLQSTQSAPSTASAASVAAPPLPPSASKSAIFAKTQTRFQPPSSPKYKRHTESNTTLSSPSPSPKQTSASPQSRPEIASLAAPSGPLFSLVNPPECTRPPTLSLPAPKPDQSRVSGWMAQGKAYLAFYKQGVKNVFAMIKLGRQLRRDRAGSAHWKSDLSRAELELLVRSAAALRRVPIFGIFLLLAGEWLPLIVPFITPIVPGPCLLPTQITTSVARANAARARISQFWKPSGQGGKSSIHEHVQQLVLQARPSGKESTSGSGALTSGSTSASRAPPSFLQSVHEATMLMTYLGQMSPRWARLLQPRPSTPTTPPFFATVLSSLFFPRTRLRSVLGTISQDDGGFLRILVTVPELNGSSGGSGGAAAADRLDPKHAIRAIVDTLLDHEVVAACETRGITSAKGSAHVVGKVDDMRDLLVDWLVKMYTSRS